MRKGVFDARAPSGPEEAPRRGGSVSAKRLLLVLLWLGCLACLATGTGERAASPLRSGGRKEPSQHAPSHVETQRTEPKTVRSDGNPWGQPAREVLIQHCGRCHRSDLPTALPRALAVFDLSEDLWFGRMTDRQLEELGRRVRVGGAVADSDKDLVERFVGCALGGSCENAETK